MAAAAMASLNVTAALPALSCSRDNALNMSSSANFVGMRLDTATTAASPSLARSSRSLVVRAEEKPSLWETITSAFGVAKTKVADVAAQGEKELNKAASEAKSTSADFGGKAEELKREAQAKAEEVAAEAKTRAEEGKAGAEEAKTKVDEAVEAAKTK